MELYITGGTNGVLSWKWADCGHMISLANYKAHPGHMTIKLSSHIMYLLLGDKRGYMNLPSNCIFHCTSGRGW